MMNLEEILRGIGQQMSRSIPQWEGPLQPQVQAPTPNFEVGPWGQAASNMFPSLPNSITSGFESSPFGSAPGFAGFPGAQQDAMAHVNAAKNAITAAVSPTGTATQDPAEVEAYIRQAAAARHIDPEVAVRVWGSEGKGNYIGDQGSSFGPYQLHYGNVAGGGNSVGGLGDAFTKATGMDARDPNTWKAQVDWSLNQAVLGGWGPWHGHQGDPWEGIGSNARPQTLSINESNPGAPPKDAHNSTRPSQFDPQLNASEQLSACGPAAAAGMAAALGKNFSVRQALDTARTSGLWSSGTGMFGPQSEITLLGKLGIQAHSEGVDWNRVNQIASPNSPVIVDTPGHYFYIDGSDGRGSYHVGTSGTDLKHGAEWMTPQQMAQLMGAPRSLIVAG